MDIQRTVKEILLELHLPDTFPLRQEGGGVTVYTWEPDPRADVVKERAAALGLRVEFDCGPPPSSRGRKARKRMREGNPLAPEMAIAEHPEGWTLYEYRRSPGKKPGETWGNLKLVYNGKRQGKANFWLAYCYERQDFGFNHDSKTLECHHPRLARWVESVLTGGGEKELDLDDLLS